MSKFQGDVSFMASFFYILVIGIVAIPLIAFSIGFHLLSVLFEAVYAVKAVLKSND
jgi:FtsH-binding integral membrane protein